MTTIENSGNNEAGKPEATEGGVAPQAGTEAQTQAAGAEVSQAAAGTPAPKEPETVRLNVKGQLKISGKVEKGATFAAALRSLDDTYGKYTYRKADGSNQSMSVRINEDTDLTAVEKTSGG